MADGGASSFIMLVTALLVSGSVSAILITQWGEVIRTAQTQDQAQTAIDSTDVDFAGDPAMVLWNSANDTMVLHFVNTGEVALDSSLYEVIVDGESPASTTERVLPSGTDWEPGFLLQVFATNSSWSFSTGDDASIFFVGVSERVGGFSHSATTNVEVRLNVV